MTVTVDPQMAPLLAKMRDRMAARPNAFSIPIEEFRRNSAQDLERWNQNLAGVTVATARFGRSGEGLRVAPDAADEGRLLIWIHGGGFVIGSPETHRGLAASLARRVNLPVLLPRYPLAPEHPYPAAITAIADTIGELRRRHPRTTLVVGGDSAGAYLAMAALRASDVDVAAFVAIYGLFSPVWKSASYSEYSEGYGLSTAAMHSFWAMFADADAGSGLDLFAARLEHMPPTHLLAAGLDPLRDDSVRMAQTLIDAGVAVELNVVPGVVHGFVHMERSLDAASRALDAVAAFIHRRTT